MKYRMPLLASGGLILFMLLVSAWAWGQVDRVPIHYGPDLKADDYASRTVGLLLTPGIAVLVVALFAAIPRFDPRREHLLASSRAYTIIWIVIVAVFAAIHTGQVLDATGRQVSETALPVALGILFIVIGNLLGKVRSNWFVGVRTPWTLSSERSWDKTNRAGGRLFVVFGIAFAASGLVRPSTLQPLLLVGLGAMVIGLVVYSFVVWKADPARRS